jgi:hypothetical protein
MKKYLVLLAVTGCGAVNDPLARLPATGSSTDVSLDLDAVLEHGRLKDACHPPRDRLLCGKSMFFYETFGTAGLPRSLVDFLVEGFPDQVGPGFEKLGMVKDPESNLPLGMAATPGAVESLAFTCASCHFARLPDGRYAVGAPNHAYEYGKQNLSIALFPSVALMGPAGHDPSAVAVIQPLLDHYQEDPSLQQKLRAAVLPLAGAGVSPPPFPAEAEAHYASWASGTMDFVIEPLPFNDGVHTVSKIPALWELPEADEIASSGMQSAMLGWTGSTVSLMRFCEGFVAFGGGAIADWPDEKLAPLVEYVYSLRRPSIHESDGALFMKHCGSCHDGPRGSGKRVYSYDEIGTDRALAKWLNPGDDGSPCCGIPADSLTRGIKSPRLVGLSFAKRFLHNGSLDSLEQLLCLEERPAQRQEPFGDDGHRFGCDLPESDRRAIIDYLRAH